MNRHVILNHIDTPLRILFWTKGELALFALPVFLGVFMNQVLLGFGLSALNLWAYKFYKSRFGKGQFQAVKYWYLPAEKKTKALPKSYIRFYVG